MKSNHDIANTKRYTQCLDFCFDPPPPFFFFFFLNWRFSLKVCPPPPSYKFLVPPLGLTATNIAFQIYKYALTLYHKILIHATLF